MVKVRKNKQHVAILNLLDLKQFMKENNVTIVSEWKLEGGLVLETLP